MNVCECLTVTAKLYPNRTAIIYNDQPLSYDWLNRSSIAAARALVDAGIKSGDRVALMLPNAPSFPIWYYATLRIGAIAVSVSTRLAANEVEFVVSDCDAKAFIASQLAMESAGPAIPDTVQFKLAADDKTGNVSDQEFTTSETTGDQTWHDADPNDPSLILYTSGTTGFPKGATLSHGNVRSNVHAFNHLCNTQPEDLVLLAVPLFHCFGQNALLNSVLNVGGTIVLQQRFDLNESKRLIAQHKVTQLYGVPMMYGLLLDSCTPGDLASVNYCFSAAATLPLQTSKAWQTKFDMPIFEGYGLTETSPFATYNHRIKFVPGSIGMPIDSVEIKIVDTESGQNCQPGELGEIAIRGPNVMLGYWNRPDETAEAIRDGWFYSGDIGRLDEDGYLFIVDRVKDMIAVGGLKVFPAEVERVLLDQPAVSEAAVIGIPDSVFGQQVIAYLVLTEAVDQAAAIEEIQQHAKTNLGNYKIPRRLVVIDQLPRNPSGKVLKTKLREMAASISTSVSSLTSEETGVTDSLKPATLRALLRSAHASEQQRIATDFLCREVRNICELDSDPEPKDSFVETGLDSLAMVALSSQLQVEVGSQTELPATLLFDHPRICDLGEFLVKLMTSADRQDSTPSQKQSSKPTTPHFDSNLRVEIEQMSEQEAIDELMKELN